MDKKEGKYQHFPSKIFCLTVPKNAVGEPFSLSLISGVEKVWMGGWGGGECQDFPSKMSCLTVPKKIVGKPFCAVFQKLSGSQKFMDKRGRGSIKIFLRKFFVSQCRKFSQVNF